MKDALAEKKEKSRIRLPDSTIDNGQERVVDGTGLGAKNRHELASSRCGYYIDVRMKENIGGWPSDSSRPLLLALTFSRREDLSFSH